MSEAILSSDIEAAKILKGKSVLVTGAGGFIGGYLAEKLIDQGNEVIGTDIKPTEQWVSPIMRDDENIVPLYDLRDYSKISLLFSDREFDYVFHLASEVGGMAYITRVAADIMRSNQLMNLNMLQASVDNNVKRFFFSSSACAYPYTLQEMLNAAPLKESDVLPANPDSYYGWEKLMMEKECEAYQRDYGIETRVARFHSIYGERCVYSGERDKAPAAFCRKVIEANDGNSIEVWGTGNQQRTFLYISDCIDGILKIMSGKESHPYNLGTKEVISIDDLADIAIKISGKTLTKKYNLDMPRGVNSRSADNTLAKEELGWMPRVTIKEGMGRLYRYIETQYASKADK